MSPSPDPGPHPAARKRLYVAYTGGTIGMARSARGFVPAPGHLARELEAVPALHHAQMPRFELHEYSPLLDSAEMRPAHWQRIADDIAARYADYDGFVVLHGTYTLAWTASALSFMLNGLAKPVVITGSQIPLSELRSDARNNLLNALYIAAHHPLPEVQVFFGDRLLRGNRSTKFDADGFDAFDSPNLAPLAHAGIRITPGATPALAPGDGPFAVSHIQAQPISVVTLYPGIDSQLIEHALQSPVKALVLRSYGVGNAPRDPALLEAFRAASARGTVIVNLSQCPRGSVAMGSYATGDALREAGVIGGADMTLEAAVTKLHVLLSRDLAPEAVREAMRRDWRGELSAP